MESSLRLCVMLVVLFGHVLAEDDIIQAADTNILSPDRRAAVEERCQNIRRDCIATGEIFRRAVVCGGGGKRFINECALQLRSCDLLLDTGEEILRERCFWVVQEEEPEERPGTNAPTTVDHSLPTPLIISPSAKIIVDYFFKTSEAPESTLVTSRRPSTVFADFFPWYSTPEAPESTLVTSRRPSTVDFFHWDSTPERHSTKGTTRNPSTEVTTTSSTEQTTNFLIDHGGIIFSSSPFHHYSWMPEFTTGESGGFRPPDEVNVRDCCRGDTPCASCLQEDKGGKVCGSDGKTYNNECDLDTHACDTGEEDLAVQSQGSCPSGGKEDNSPGPPPAPPRGDLGKR
ncbi:hypothetical protein HOLleu_05732 [Holothuria leucospilota]|uniref:Kazal-like domain-containing protein n=1 Tax=Holothuria leucospilota TaxID=206669 RepID=A0A9Q1CK95_HOLLE|nr:hypothetical protein HOLleu_05732 [Holothuria leucospilota]